MDEYWATRTGRWRKAMQGRSGPTFADRLFAVVRSDINVGALPVCDEQGRLVGIFSERDFARHAAEFEKVLDLISQRAT